MKRHEAKIKVNELIGKDLRLLADKYNVTVFNENGNRNKGWAGHVIEAHLGLPQNCTQAPDFEDWELKVSSLKYLKSGILTVKETMAITMINEDDVKNTPFQDSHLLKKMQRLLIPSRIWENKAEESSILHSVIEFDLSNPEIFNQIESDYNLVQNTIKTKGFSALSGSLGTYVQPRTKGRGNGSTSRAFYVRTGFLKEILNL